MTPRSRKTLKRFSAFVSILLLAVIGPLIYYLKYYHEDLNHPLPMTVTTQPNDSQKTVGYRVWFAYMKQYEQNNTSRWQRISFPGYTQIQVLAGNDNTFAVAVTFKVNVAAGIWSTHHSWGNVGEHGLIQNIHWTLRIHKTGLQQYTLEAIQPTQSTVSGLPPVKDEYQKRAGIPVQSQQDKYKFQDGQLMVTYDAGMHYIRVPVHLQDLFAGDYSGPKDALISGSYILTPARTAFIITDGTNSWVLQSTDMGKTWHKSELPASIKGVRMRLIDFTSTQDGHVIISGGRVMSQEGNIVFSTTDGGKHWVKTGGAPVSYLLTGGGFISKKIGFESFGSRGNPAMPVLYRTTNGGKTWSKITVPIPPQYQGVFTVAETPTFDGQQGALLVNQGPEGDFEGGKVMARFISIDKGKTWRFANLVDPNNVIH